MHIINTCIKLYGEHLAVFSLGFLGVILASTGYTDSLFFYTDDLIYIGRALAGDPIEVPANWLHYKLLYSLASLGGPLLVKLVPPVVFGASLAITFSILKKLSGSPIVAFSFAMIVVFHPVSQDQSFFLSGGHPATAALAMLVFLRLHLAHLNLGLTGNLKDNSLLMTGQLFALFIASVLSPVFSLAPFLGIAAALNLVLLGPRTSFHQVRIAFGICMLLAVLLAIYQLPNITNYHYANEADLVAYMPQQIVTNLIEAIEFMLVKPFDNMRFILALYGAVILAVVIFAWRYSRGNQSYISQDNQPAKNIVIGVALITLMAAAVTFGPSSILTRFVSRYAYAPSMFGLLLVAILLARPAARLLLATPRRRLMPLFLILAVIPFIHYFYQARTFIAPYLEAHALIKNAVADETWSPNDQILVLLPNHLPISSRGFNHWSTWYLRILTGQRDMIGLIGSEKMIADLYQNGPYVASYADHGSPYWGKRNGQKRRLRMVGLESDRKIHFFRSATPEGSLELQPIRFWGAEEKGVKNLSATTLCNASNFQDGLDIYTGRAPTSDVDEVLYSRKNLHFNGENSETISIDVSEHGPVSIFITLYSANSAPPLPDKYNATSPHMPLVSPVISIYEKSGEFQIASHSGDLDLRIPKGEGNRLSLSILGCEGGAAFMFGNGTFLGVTINPTLSGDWKFGKGFKQRYWTGTIETVQIGRAISF